MYLYIGSSGYVSAIDPSNGSEVWRTQLGGGFFGSSHSDVCVLEHEGKVFAGSGGYLFALNGITGEIIWQNDLSGMGYDDVSLAMAGKSIQYVSSHSKSD